MMKKTIVLLFLGIFLFQHAYAQEKFKNGYVILNDGDTLYGLINVESNSTRSCKFKEKENTPVKSYSPYELISFHVNDKYFISKDLNENQDSKIFMEVLFKGIIYLYSYFNEAGVHYMIESPDGYLKELKNETRRVLVNNVTYERESKEYIATLKQVFSESPAIRKKVESSTLTLNTLINLSEEYHNEVCPSEECIIYARRKNRLKFSPALVAGFHASDFDISTSSPEINERYSLPAMGTGYRVGIIINARDDFFSRRISVRTGVVFFNSNHKTTESDLRLMRLSVPVQIVYGIPVGKFRISTIAGFAYDKILKFEYSTASYGDNRLLSNSYFLGFSGGLEMSYQNKRDDSVFINIGYDRRSDTNTGYWKGKNYGQWGGIQYDPTFHIGTITSENCLSLVAGYRF